MTSLLIAWAITPVYAAQEYVYQAGHPSLQEWLLPATPPEPADNIANEDRIDLGKKLFFDTRLSGDGNMSCGSCHSPLYGWSDGLPTAKGAKSRVLPRATPTIVNTGYNTIQMWDGREKSLEAQAMGPIQAEHEMNMDTAMLFKWLSSNESYASAFEKAYPGEGITASTFSKSIAAFERTVVSNNSSFDQWIKGDEDALSAQQINGFKVFVEKGKCAVCHSAPNFTDDGFHNIGLASFEQEEPDLGRYEQRPLALMKGAFKTPTLRDVTLTAPYFHDGSATSLEDIVEHYVTGGVVKTNLSPNFEEIELSEEEKENLIGFMQALTTPQEQIALPKVPIGLVLEK